MIEMKTHFDEKMATGLTSEPICCNHVKKKDPGNEFAGEQDSINIGTIRTHSI